MAAEYPITENLVEAFCTAIMAFDGWKWGDPEPLVFLDGKCLPVSAVANSVSASSDPMPDSIYNFLCRVIGARMRRPIALSQPAGTVCTVRAWTFERAGRDNRPQGIPTAFRSNRLSGKRE